MTSSKKWEGKWDDESEQWAGNMPDRIVDNNRSSMEMRRRKRLGLNIEKKDDDKK